MFLVRFGIPGNIVPLVLLSAGHALFQAASTTAVMRDIGRYQRGVVSGMLKLSRSLGLITSASVMGAVFALAARATDITAVSVDAIATDMRVTFAVAAVLILAALTIAVGIRASATRPSL